MVLLRHVFQTQWGRAHEVVAGMKESAGIVAEVVGGRNLRLLTDLSGEFHRVIQEFEVESMAKWEQTGPRLFSHPEFQQAQAKLEGLIISGHREFYTVEYPG